MPLPKFWISTLKNIKSSYRKWVHIYEAKMAGVNVMNILNKKNDKSVYAINRRKKFNDLSIDEQIKRFGYWDMNKYNIFENCYFYKRENIYFFSGIIASLRIIGFGKKKTIICSICVGKGYYIELLIKNKYYNKNSYGIKGRATLNNKEEKSYIAFIAVFY